MIYMELHDDWQPLFATFKEHHGSNAKAEAPFNKFCEGKGINPKEPKQKNVFGYDWTGEVLLEGDWKELAEELGVEAEEGMYLVGGRAIHPCKTHHPNEWPEWRIYLEAELAASAATAKNQPFWMDHAIPLGNRNKIFGARYFDGELQYVGQVEEYLKNMIESGEIKHISPGFEWTVLEKLNGIAPRGIRYYEFSLLKNLRPGDATTTVELWEALLGHCTEGVRPASGYKAVELNQFIESKLLESRILMFHGSVDEGICREASQRLEYMASVSDEPIKIILNSVGGGVFNGLLVFDTIKGLVGDGIDIVCEARGLAASMGSIILQAGTRRTATPHTRFLIHEVSSVAWGKSSTVTEEAEEIKKVNDLLKNILAERSGKTPDEIEAVWRKTDVWMSATEAKEFGLIDEIVTGIAEGHHPTVGFFTAPFSDLALDSTIQCPACGYVSTKDQWLQAGMGGDGKCTQCSHEVQAVTLVEAKLKGRSNAIDYAAIYEALGMTEEAFNKLGWEARFIMVADIFDKKLKETKYPIEYFQPGDWLTCPSCGAVNLAGDYEDLQGSRKCPACFYLVLPGTLVEGRKLQEQVYHDRTTYRHDLANLDLVQCPSCGGKAEWVQYYQNGFKCPLCNFVIDHDTQVRVVGKSTLGEATAAQAREHHGLSQEEWDALSEEEKAAKIASTPDAAEGLKEATAEQARDHHGISQEDWDALSDEDKTKKMESTPATAEGAAPGGQYQFAPYEAYQPDATLDCPNCGIDVLKSDAVAMGDKCNHCGYQFAAEVLYESGRAKGANRGTVLMLLERSMSAQDAIFSSYLIECPECKIRSNAALFDGGICPNCGRELGFEELVEVYSDIWEAMTKEILRTKALAGEAVLVPTTMSSLEIPGYISASIVEALIPKQMHHRAAPGYHRVIRELRSLVKKSREVN